MVHGSAASHRLVGSARSSRADSGYPSFAVEIMTPGDGWLARGG